MNFEEALSACLEANLKITFLVLIGAVLAYSGHLDQKGVSDLGAITYYVALPSLIFTNVGSSLQPEDLEELWIFPVTAVVYVFFAFGVAYCLCRVLWVNKVEENAVIAAMMFGNTGSLAIAIMASLATAASPESVEGIVKKAVSYIALFLVGQNLIMFSWGEVLLSKTVVQPKLVPSPIKTAPQGTKKQSDAESTGESIAKLKEESRPKSESAEAEKISLLVHESHSETEDDASSASVYGTVERPRKRAKETHYTLHRESTISPSDLTRVISRIALDSQALIATDVFAVKDKNPSLEDNSVLHDDLFGEDYLEHIERDLRKNSSATSLILVKSKWEERFETVRDVLKRVLSSPPLLGAIFGLLVAAIPPLQRFLFGPSAPLRSLTGALSSAGKMQVPASMLMLSGAGTIRIMESLRSRRGAPNNPNPRTTDFQFSPGARAIILFGRSISMAIIGFGWYAFCVKVGFLTDVGLIPFVLFLEAVVPSAQNVVMLLLVHGDVEQGRAMAVAILEQYAVSIPFLTLYLVYFLVITKPFDD